MTKHRITSCDSAQIEVFKLLSQGEKDVMVFCDRQLKGEGRRQREWFSAQSAIAMSFDLAPCAKLSLTSLELGALVCEFLKQRGLETRLKWPNDLVLQDGKKCGGILIQSKKGHLVAGIGLNLYHPKEEIPADLKRRMGSLCEREEMDPWPLSTELYDYICAHRLSSAEVVLKWSGNCAHLGKKVKAIEDGEALEGTFLGIGQDGEALIETPLEIKRVYNASLIVS